MMPGHISIGTLINVPLRHYRLVLATIAVMVVAAVIYVSLERPEYRASAAIRLGSERRFMTEGIEKEEPVVPSTRPLLSTLQYLRSRQLVGEVVASLGLQLKPDYNKFDTRLLSDVQVDSAVRPDTIDVRFEPEGIRIETRAGAVDAPYGRAIQLPGLTFTIASQPQADGGKWIVMSREQAIDRVLANLRARQRPYTNVIDLWYLSPSALEAQLVVNTMVEVFGGERTRVARRQSHLRRVFLEEQLGQMDSVLSEAQSRLAQFRAGAGVYSSGQNQIFNSGQKLTAGLNDLMALELRVEELDAERRMYRSLVDAARRAPPQERGPHLRALVSSPQMSSNPVVAQLYSQLTRYQTDWDSLTTGQWRRAPTDPDVQRLDQLINSTETQLIGAADSYVATLDARLTALHGLRSRSEASVRSLPAAEVEEARLTQRVEALRRLADKLREDHQKARIAEAVEVGEVEVMDYAALPYAPQPQMRLLKLGMGGSLGLILGVLVAFLKEMKNRSIRNRDELERTLGVPTLAVIPRLMSESTERQEKPFLPSGADRNGSDKHAIMLRDVNPIGLEAFRALRTNLLFSQNFDRRRTIVVTSTAPREGKTVTAANLAIIFAGEGMRVVLVDCDIRRPRMHRLFDIKRSPGLADVLSQPDAPPGAIVETTIEGLYLVPAGKKHPNPSELLNGTKMRALLAWLTQQFDLVIIDTPPVLAVSDAAIVGALADGVIMVIRAQETDRSAAREALGRLEGVGAPVMGTVLNDPSGTALPYSDYFYEYSSAGAKG